MTKNRAETPQLVPARFISGPFLLSGFGKLAVFSN